MAKVTRIAYSKNLTQSKYNRLSEMAKRLGSLRKEVWHRFGGIQGAGLTSRQIRDGWLRDGREFNVPARLWKATLRDAMADIEAYREAAKVKVRKAIHRRADSEEERKRLYRLLRNDKWPEDNFLHRMMRKHYKHGRTDVNNQIVLDTNSYKAFERGGRAWVKVQSLVRGERITIPLNTKEMPVGTLRLIIRNGLIEIHYAVDERGVCSTAPCGSRDIGIDKGYTEAFVDSDGDTHGAGLGEVLSAESDYLKLKYQRRNRLTAIAEAKPHKRRNIEQNNLGRKKLDARRKKHKQRVRDLAFKAAHSVVYKALVVVCEDLTSPIRGNSFGKNQNRRLSGWVKGLLAEAINAASRRRGASVTLVNAAYTSQTDSRYGILMGKRTGNQFYCFDGEVLDADFNAARNILARKNDTEIRLYTPYLRVKQILQERTAQRMGLLIQDSSCTLYPTKIQASTESELPDFV